MDPTKTFFFYDLETSGLSPREDRIMQFAGLRTDLNFNPIGDPVNLLVKLSDDTLPSPGAIQVTKITPQQTLQDGLTEAEFAKYVQEEIFIENTCAVGYNSIRFDDEFMRHLFWRTFYDPYAWQWRDGRSKWDLLDVVRLTRALRPEGINWPVGTKEIIDQETGESKTVEFSTNRLELLTKLNGISHEHAHDALSDVYALVSVTKMIKDHQPDLFNYLFKMRNKKEIQKLVNLERPMPFVYACGRYPSQFEKTTVAYPIAPAKNGNVLVFDLRHDPSEENAYPTIKELKYNHCPAVAPLGVLEKNDGWQKLQLDKTTIEQNMKKLHDNPAIIEKARTDHEEKPDFEKPFDAESALYDGFLGEQDARLVNLVHESKPNDLADLHPNFIDERLTPLLLHYKAKNFPQSLSEDENKKWEDYRRQRLERQAPKFLEELQKMAQSKNADSFVVEELKLWYESLA